MDQQLEDCKNHFIKWRQSGKTKISKDAKYAAVNLLDTYQVKDLAVELQINKKTLYRWRKELSCNDLQFINIPVDDGNDLKQPAILSLELSNGISLKIPSTDIQHTANLIKHIIEGVE